MSDSHTLESKLRALQSEVVYPVRPDEVRDMLHTAAALALEEAAGLFIGDCDCESYVDDLHELARRCRDGR